MLKPFLMLTVWGAVLAVALADIYSYAISWGSDDIISIAAVNTLLSIPILWILLRRVPGVNNPLFPPKQDILGDLLPACTVAGLAFLAALSTRVALEGVVVGKGYSVWDVCKVVVWIPIVEELVFRVGVGGVMRRAGGPLLGGYFSALFFGFMHSLPSMERVLAGNVGIAFGPFLLGIICEYLYVKRGRVLPIVLFHAACNATVFIFGVVDERWLEWLAVFYS